jgi:CDP-2,3-bis-(O-geranylgeranyl)-sn-glycerol synthase
MADTGEFLLRCAWYLLPMGFANIAPVLFRNRFSWLAIPVDRYIGNRGVFGSHKTIRGLLVAVLCGLVGFWWQQLVSALPRVSALGFFSYADMTLWFGVCAGLGAILGDLVRSAVKRRVGIRPGGRFVPFDQIDYVLGGVLLTLPFFQPSLQIVLGVFVAGFLLHVATSIIGYGLGMKRDRL